MSVENVPRAGPNRDLVNTLPSDWRVTTLGQLKEFSKYGLNESAEKREDEEQPRYIRVTDIEEVGLGKEDKTVACSVDKEDLLEDGDLLFARSGSIGEVYLHNGDENYTHGGYTIRYRVDNSDIDPEFLYYYTQSNIVQNWFDRRSRGSTQVNISTSELDSLVVPVQPVEEQERIVSLLSDVDEYIEKSSERVTKLQAQKQATLQQIFGNDGEIFKDKDGTRIAPAAWSRFKIPSNWNVYKLGDSCSIQTGNGFKSEYFNSDGGGWPLVKRATVNGTEDEPTYTTEEFDERYIVQEGDVLVSMDGNFEVTIWDEPKSALNQRVCKITSETNEINNEYLGYVLQPIIKQCEKSTGGTTVASLSNSQLNKINIPVPPVEEQSRIVSILSDIDSAIEKTQSDLDQMRSLKQGLLQNIFSTD